MEAFVKLNIFCKLNIRRLAEMISRLCSGIHIKLRPLWCLIMIVYAKYCLLTCLSSSIRNIVHFSSAAGKPK